MFLIHLLLLVCLYFLYLLFFTLDLFCFVISLYRSDWTGSTKDCKWRLYVQTEMEFSIRYVPYLSSFYLNCRTTSHYYFIYTFFFYKHNQCQFHIPHYKWLILHFDFVLAMLSENVRHKHYSRTHCSTGILSQYLIFASDWSEQAISTFYIGLIKLLFPH